VKSPNLSSLWSGPLWLKPRVVLLTLVSLMAAPLLPQGNGSIGFPLSEAMAQANQAVFPHGSWERIGDPEEVGYSAQGLDAVRAYAETIPTTGLMVVVGGRVLFEYGDVEEISYLASVRKSILSMLYGNYVEKGVIDLEKTLEELGMDDVGGLLPIERKARVHDLITARSGVYHPASNPGDALADAPPRGSQEPGTYMLYSNWDFNAAGGAFELMTGVDIFDALQSDLAEPLGFQDFQRELHQKGGDMERSLYPSYHMHLSTRDMARVGYLMLREGNWDGEQIIPAQWARTISSVVTPLEEMNPERMRDGSFGYGYMWWIFDGPRTEEAFRGAYSGQGAYGQYITVLPALDMVVVHKTAVSPQRGFDRRTSGSQYQGILDRLVEARR
jgi:CubicO group peptidase (beta-lactamase class C family)